MIFMLKHVDKGPETRVRIGNRKMWKTRDRTGSGWRKDGEGM